MKSMIINKSNIVNIAIDMGKNELEGLLFDNEGTILKSVNFDSVIKRLLTKPVSIGNSNPNRFKVKYNGKYYEIGDEIEKGTYSNDNSKLTEHHKLCLLLAIGLLCEGDSNFVNLLVGLPSSHIANPLEKENFEKMLKEEEGKEMVIEINGVEKRFVISKITPDSEGLAIIPRLKLAINENNKYNIAVIDIGGHNFNLRRFNAVGFSLDDKGISEESVGINNLLTRLHDELISGLKDRNRSITRGDLKRFVKERKLDDDMSIPGYENNSNEFISDFVKNYIDIYIDNKLSAHGIKPSAKGMIYLFTGGGSNLLRPYIEEMYSDNLEYIKFSDTAKWDNCLSFVLNYLFKISTDSSKVFSNICNEFDKKLSNKDKDLDFSAIDNMKALMATTN